LAEQAQVRFGPAVLRRYGGDEPLEHRFRDGGVTGLRVVWDTIGVESLSFSSEAFPFSGGSMTTLMGSRQAGDMWQLSLTAVADALVDAERRRSFLDFFVGVADESQAVYASAEVDGGYFWDGEVSSRYDEGERHAPVWRGYAGRRGNRPVGLLGLTPYPTWWAWFGGGYREMLADRLSRPPSSWRVRPTQAGMLVELAELPARRAELQSRLGGLLRTGWVPASLTSARGRPARIRLGSVTE